MTVLGEKWTAWHPQPLLHRVETDWTLSYGIELALLRLDAIDPLISGNKWYKLTGHLRQAEAEGCSGLISLGGAHSNHLHALAAAGQRFGFATVGLLRGERRSTPTVDDLLAFGMSLHWLGYGGYRRRNEPDFWDSWRARYPGFKAVPEGGGGWLGAQGCQILVEDVRRQLPAISWEDYDSLWVAAGTGTTLAGLVIGERGEHSVYGAMAVPQGHGLYRLLDEVFRQSGYAYRDYLLLDASRGGFARMDDELISFMTSFERATGVALDPCYTGKMLLKIKQLIESGSISRGHRLIAIHSGGLQGRRAMLAS